MEYALIMTLVDSGCRIGGLSKLKGGDVGDSWLNMRKKNWREKVEVRCQAL